jgi:hypothetical protein
MHKNKYEEQMKKLGWSWLGTGGGCDSYAMNHSDNGEAGVTVEKTLLITKYNDSNIPTRRSDKITIGFYSNEDGWAGIGDFEMTCKFSDILDGKIKFRQWGKGI